MGHVHPASQVTHAEGVNFLYFESELFVLIISYNEALANCCRIRMSLYHGVKILRCEGGLPKA